MEEKKNKKLKILIIVGIVLVLVSGVTLAYFMSRRTGTPTTVEAKDLAITYTNESKFNIDSAIDPIMESDILTSAPKVEFTVTNTGEDNVYLQFDIVDIELNKFKDYDFKWALYQGETKITTGSFIAEEDGKVTLAAGKVLAPSTPTTYQVYVWINETTKDQSDMMAGTFTGTVQVTGYGKDNTLAGKILTSGTIYDNTSSDHDYGLFVQQGDSTKSNFGFPTYYFKGHQAYYNNPMLVSFAGKTWRIVRINEDGSIKLMDNFDSLIEVVYDNTQPYTSNYIGSNAETLINEWYNNNIGSNSGTTLDNLVQTGNFCNDISDNYSAVQTRITNNNPIFTCPNDGVMINAKAGMITADELMYYTSEAGDSFFMYDTFMTMSPSALGSVFYTVNYSSVGGLHGAPVETTEVYSVPSIIRLVINLKPDVTVKSGDGTSGTPYVIG